MTRASLTSGERTASDPRASVRPAGRVKVVSRGVRARCAVRAVCLRACLVRGVRPRTCAAAGVRCGREPLERKKTQLSVLSDHEKTQLAEPKNLVHTLQLTSVQA